MEEKSTKKRKKELQIPDKMEKLSKTKNNSVIYWSVYS